MKKFLIIFYGVSFVAGVIAAWVAWPVIADVVGEGSFGTWLVTAIGTMIVGYMTFTVMNFIMAAFFFGSQLGKDRLKYGMEWMRYRYYRWRELKDASDYTPVFGHKWPHARQMRFLKEFHDSAELRKLRFAERRRGFIHKLRGREVDLRNLYVHTVDADALMLWMQLDASLPRKVA